MYSKLTFFHLQWLQITMYLYPHVYNFSAESIKNGQLITDTTDIYVHVGTHISVLPLFSRLYALHTCDQLCEHRLVVHGKGGLGQRGVDLGEPVLVPLQQVRHSLGEDLLS